MESEVKTIIDEEANIYTHVTEDNKKAIAKTISAFLQQHSSEYKIELSNHSERRDELVVDIIMKPNNVVYMCDPIVYNVT